MSEDKYVYAGVYLEVPIVKNEVLISYRLDSKGNKTDAVYDPYTGEKLKEIEKTKIETEYPYAYIDEDSEILIKFGLNEGDEDTFFDFDGDDDYNDAVRYFGLNKKSKYTIPMNVAIDSLDIPQLIADFKKDYKNYLEYYKSIGYEITVKFGILTYYS